MATSEDGKLLVEQIAPTQHQSEWLEQANDLYVIKVLDAFRFLLKHSEGNETIEAYTYYTPHLLLNRSISSD